MTVFYGFIADLLAFFISFCDTLYNLQKCQKEIITVYDFLSSSAAETGGEEAAGGEQQGEGAQEEEGEVR